MSKEKGPNEKKRRPYSRESEVEEYGEIIWGAKKHLFGVNRVVSEERIRSMGEERARIYIRKKRILPEFNLDELLESRKTAGHIFYRKYLYRVIPNSPQLQTVEGRLVYVRELEFLMDTLHFTRSTTDLFFYLRNHWNHLRKESWATYLDVFGITYLNAIGLLVGNKSVFTAKTQSEELESGNEIAIALPKIVRPLEYEEELVVKQGEIVIQTSVEGDYLTLEELLTTKKKGKKGKSIGEHIKKWRESLMERYQNLEESRFDFSDISDAYLVEKMALEFNLKAVQFGNYVPDSERVIFIKLTYGALYDLAKLLLMDPKDLSFGNNLSIAIGARGSGTAAAHYEPVKKIINLTRKRGNGSIAHEWGHAFDNFLVRALENRDEVIETHLSTFDMETLDLRERFIHLPPKKSKSLLTTLRTLLLAIQGSEFAMRSKSHGSYWGSTIELFARAFESYIYDSLQNLGRDNFYLVFPTRGDETQKQFSLYPQKDERRKLNALFDGIFQCGEGLWSLIW